MPPAPSPSRDRPLPADWTVEQGRDAYLRENGFSVAAYDEPWTKASLLGIPFSVPNPPIHRRAIMLHDLHHVATGFGTDVTGEAEISAWETRRGILVTGLYVTGIVVGLAALGALVSPRRTLRAFRDAPGRRSLFHEKRAYEELLRLSVGELRDSLGLPREGLARAPRRLHGKAPRG